MPCISHDNCNSGHASLWCDIVFVLNYSIAGLHSFIALLFSYTSVAKPNYSKTCWRNTAQTEYTATFLFFSSMLGLGYLSIRRITGISIKYKRTGFTVWHTLFPPCNNYDETCTFTSLCLLQTYIHSRIPRLRFGKTMPRKMNGNEDGAHRQKHWSMHSADIILMATFFHPILPTFRFSQQQTQPHQRDAIWPIYRWTPSPTGFLPLGGEQPSPVHNDTAGLEGHGARAPSPGDRPLGESRAEGRGPAALPAPAPRSEAASATQHCTRRTGVRRKTKANPGWKSTSAPAAGSAILSTQMEEKKRKKRNRV